MRLTRRQLLHATGTALALGGFAQPAGAQTPDSVSAGENALLLEFASCIPQSLVAENASAGQELLVFADYAYRLQSVGIDLASIADPDEAFRAFARSTLPLPAADIMVATTRTQDPFRIFGWTLGQVEQCSYVMSSEGTLTVLRGAFNRAAIEAAWIAQGYQSLDVDGIAVASISAERTLDLSSEIGQLTLGNAGNAAFLDDGYLLYAPSLAALTAMIHAHTGTVDSLAIHPLVQSVVSSVPDRLSGAIILPPGAFIAAPPVLLGDPDTELVLPEPGPIPLMGLVGFVSGSAVPDADIPSGSTFVSSRHFLTTDEAELAARRTLLTLESQYSMVSERQWSDIFAGWSISLDQDETNVLTAIDLIANEGIWSQIIYQRDASFLYG